MYSNPHNYHFFLDSFFKTKTLSNERNRIAGTGAIELSF
jgi:hypothetical protein